MKMLALYTLPDDPVAFLAHYKAVHMPLVRKIPGLISANVTHVTRTLIGQDGNFLLAEMTFSDGEALKKALRSPENAAVGADAMGFAGKIITVMTGEVLDI
jgi:uncharacterized protein (TIGR02118 family)